MDGFDEIDWETVWDFVRRFGGFLLAVLFALAARSRKKSAPEESAPVEPAELAVDRNRREIQSIEPGVDATKLAREFSQHD